MIRAGAQSFPHHPDGIQGEAVNKLLNFPIRGFPAVLPWPARGFLLILPALSQLFQKTELFPDIVRRIPVHAHGLITRGLIGFYNLQGNLIAQDIRPGQAGRGPQGNIDIRGSPFKQIIIFFLRQGRMDSGIP